MYISRHHTNDSYPDLARTFGRRHHTSVISAVQRIIERIKDDASLRAEIHAIESLILR
jgi:chromosomal replication initiation ATPase DnaA